MLKQRFGKKGFTMAELLIVIAIIAILIAIALPVFGSQLNKAKLAVAAANVRSAYSEAVAKAMLDENALGVNTEGKLSIKVTQAELETVANEILDKEKKTTNVSYDPTTKTITVAFAEDTDLKQSFKIDEDVTIETAETPAK